MKDRRLSAWTLAAAALSLALASCASAPQVPYRDAKPVARADLGSPFSHTLLFGFVESESNTVVRLFAGASVDNLEMIQLNPAIGAMLITPARKDALFFTHPLPAGSAIKLYSFSQGVSRGKVLHLEGIQRQCAMDAILSKPGLLYLGSLEYTSMMPGPGGKLVAADSMDFRAVGKYKEVEGLRMILPFYSGTAWESIIKTRIEELAK